MSEITFSRLVEREVIALSFNFQEPLSKLRTLLEELWQVSLTECSFWLQETLLLDEDKSLTEHGIYGKGAVEIKLHLKMKDSVEVINIVDVLKSDGESSSSGSDSNDRCMRWVESKEFKSQRVRRNMSASLEEWNADDVKCWIEWAMKKFQLMNVDLNAWRITGRDVKGMTKHLYNKLIPSDPSGQFWTHLQVLQKYGQVTVPADEKNYEEEPQSSAPNMILICKFLLNLLSDKQCTGVIRWLNDEGEFEFVQPNVVASMWGVFEQNTEMTLEKMVRVLKRQNTLITTKGDDVEYIYKFNFDVREVLGYTPMELDKLLKEL